MLPAMKSLCVSLRNLSNVGRLCWNFIRVAVVIVIFRVVALCRQIHEDRRQQREHQRLNNTDEELQNEERPRQERQQEAHDKQQDRPGENIAEKSEGKRENTRELADQLQQAHCHVDTTQRRCEQRAEIEELRQVASAQRSEA